MAGSEENEERHSMTSLSENGPDERGREESVRGCLDIPVFVLASPRQRS